MDWSSIALKDIIEIRVDIEIFAFRFAVILCFDRDGYIRYSLKSCLLYAFAQTKVATVPK